MENLEENAVEEDSTTRNGNLVNREVPVIDLDQPLDLRANITVNYTPGLQAALTIGNESVTCSKNDLPGITKTSIDVPSTSAAAAAASIEAYTTNSKETIDKDPPTNSTALECPICLQTCIHPARLPCGHIFCFLCVKGVAYKNKRCAMCRREIPPEFLNHPQLVNGIEDIFSTKTTEDGYQWFYEGRNGGWWAYDKRSALELEAAYQQLQQRCQNSKLNMDIIDFAAYTYDLLICGNMYTIDFENWIQYPQHMPYKERKICRAKNMPHKGWWQYDDRTSQDIEEAYKKSEKSCVILVAGYVYMVDLETMVQQRQNEPSRCRRVKRDLATIPKKGVAGLRIEDNIVTAESNFPNQIYEELPDNVVGSNHDRNFPISLGQPIDTYMDNLGLGGLNASIGSPSEFVSTIAATDAAIRIASDIIGSTLAHADELTRQSRAELPNVHSPTADLFESDYMGEFNEMLMPTRTGSAPDRNNQLAITAAAGRAGALERGSLELLGAAEDLLGATQRVIATADQFTIDLFEQTLDDLHALSLRNLIDSQTDDDIELLNVSSAESHNSDNTGENNERNNTDEPNDSMYQT